MSYMGALHRIGASPPLVKISHPSKAMFLDIRGTQMCCKSFQITAVLLMNHVVPLERLQIPS